MNGQKVQLLGRSVTVLKSRSKGGNNIWEYILKKPAKRERVDKSKRYADTLCLPQTKFPLSVKDGLAPKREADIQRVCMTLPTQVE
jgi:hypothetical protein